ncbi:phosphoribosyl-AMP cyclohydrolase [Candidatus Woesearchaeota archaeon]|nr:phosphoribosyl-AMP cyclohydrolase [Candidatus Woesearchaeota archaeon]
MKEETLELKLDFSKLIPVITQDINTKDVLFVAFANKKAYDNTLATRNATYWSRSRNELWEKGKTSGDYLKIKEIRINCEQNSLLYLVEPVKENACHTNRKSCYYRRIKDNQLEYI